MITLRQVSVAVAAQHHITAAQNATAVLLASQKGTNGEGEGGNNSHANQNSSNNSNNTKKKMTSPRNMGSHRHLRNVAADGKSGSKRAAAGGKGGETPSAPRPTLLFSKAATPDTAAATAAVVGSDFSFVAPVPDKLHLAASADAAAVNATATAKQQKQQQQRTLTYDMSLGGGSDGAVVEADHHLRHPPSPSAFLSPIRAISPAASLRQRALTPQQRIGLRTSPAAAALRLGTAPTASGSSPLLRPPQSQLSRPLGVPATPSNAHHQQALNMDQSSSTFSPFPSRKRGGGPNGGSAGTFIVPLLGAGGEEVDVVSHSRIARDIAGDDSSSCDSGGEGGGGGNDFFVGDNGGVEVEECRTERLSRAAWRQEERARRRSLYNTAEAAGNYGNTLAFGGAGVGGETVIAERQAVKGGGGGGESPAQQHTTTRGAATTATTTAFLTATQRLSPFSAFRDPPATVQQTRARNERRAAEAAAAAERQRQIDAEAERRASPFYRGDRSLLTPEGRERAEAAQRARAEEKAFARFSQSRRALHGVPLRVTGGSGGGNAAGGGGASSATAGGVGSAEGLLRSAAAVLRSRLPALSTTRVGGVSSASCVSQHPSGGLSCEGV